MSTVRITAVTGNLRSPSRTVALAQRIAQAVQAGVAAELGLVDLGEIGSSLGATLSRSALEGDAKAAVESVETADLLIVVTPVYRGAYTGLLKHLFDLVDGDALVDTPVILAANGGDQRHSLAVDHLLRPLFAFFRAQPVAESLYAEEKDFASRVLVNVLLEQRIERVARSAVALLSARRAAE